MIITLPSQLISVTDLKDRSCKLAFETRELENNEFSALRDVRGREGWLGFSLNEIHEGDMPEKPAEVEGKTPSQRLRSVLYVLWKQEKSELPFQVWYESKIESIIQKVKDRLDS
jgi:hypothetical protein